jgi:hypothetical protein
MIQRRNHSCDFFLLLVQFSGSRQKWSYAAIANFCIGVMPPSAMFVPSFSWPETRLAILR